MQTELQKEYEATRITIFYFPIITLILLILNVVIYFSVSLLSVPMPPEHSLRCVANQAPQCLEAINEKVYSMKITECFMGKPADPVICYYNFKYDCLKYDVLKTCFSLKDRIGIFFGTIPKKIVQGQSAFTLITYQFLHLNLLHLFYNMLFFLLLGPFLESRLGKFRYITLYLASGVLAGLVDATVRHASAIPGIGASGALMGLAGANLLINYFTNSEYDSGQMKTVPNLFGLSPRGLKIHALLLIFFYEIVYALININGNIGYAAHIGGFISGVFLALLLKPKKRIALNTVTNQRG